eukprot:4424853-Pyramimonas_sp.AAC.1
MMASSARLAPLVAAGSIPHEQMPRAASRLPASLPDGFTAVSAPEIPVIHLPSNRGRSDRHPGRGRRG